MENSLAFTTFAFLHGGLLHASAWKIAMYVAVMTHITILAVTIYLHRCQAHHALSLHPAISHFFRFWLWPRTGMVTREWVAVHRKHHAMCETAGDPHSPIIRGIWKVLLSGAELYRVEASQVATIQKYGRGAPEDWIERALYGKYTWQGLGVLLIIDMALFGAIGLTVWGIQMLWIPVTAAGVVNGIGHFLGYRNFASPDASKNFSPVGLLIGGEELHNNHHTFPTSARMSVKWFEFDIGWCYIRLLATLGLACGIRLAPVPRWNVDKADIDLSTLLAVVRNRYYVIADYERLVRRIRRGEARRARAMQAISKEGIRPPPLAWTAEPGYPETVLPELSSMRVDLERLWQRSSADADALLCGLRQWCAAAESSGIDPLRQFSRRLRSYD